MTHPLMAVWMAFVGVLLALLIMFAAFGAMGTAGHTIGGMWDMMGNGDMHGGMMGGGGPRTTASASGEATVRIVDFTYRASDLTVTPGTVVTWTNEDTASHTATGDGFDTGKLDEGESASVTFDDPGTFDYICTYHPDMKGLIIVRP